MAAYMWYPKSTIDLLIASKFSQYHWGLLVREVIAFVREGDNPLILNNHMFKDESVSRLREYIHSGVIEVFWGTKLKAGIAMDAGHAPEKIVITEILWRLILKCLNLKDNELPPTPYPQSGFVQAYFTQCLEVGQYQNSLLTTSEAAIWPEDEEFMKVACLYSTFVDNATEDCGKCQLCLMNTKGRQKLIESGPFVEDGQNELQAAMGNVGMDYSFFEENGIHLPDTEELEFL